MDFTLPEELLIFRDTLRKFVEKELEPISEQVEEEDHIPDRIVEKMKDLGLFGLAIPSEHGGYGMSVLGQCVAMEELSRTNACFRTRIGTNNGIGSMGIVIAGTEEQKRKYLPRLASGAMTGAFALTEPNAGSDASAIRTTAVRKGDKYILNGTKHFITNGDIAGLSTVMALTDRPKGTKGISAFLVEEGFPGFSVGKIERKMGFRGSHTCELLFDDCEVPAENLLGREGEGFRIAMQVLDKGRLMMGACALGAIERLIELSTTFAKTRVTFGEPIINRQAIQWMLVNMAIDAYAVRNAVYHAAWKLDRGERVTKEAAMVKVLATETACRAADSAVQIHGGMGYMKGMAVERFYRDLRLLRIYEGTSEILRMIVAREMSR
ncbi:MAG: acyl-CoA dehydrogenase family protein [Deltaproteobacteria bacterium]|nr:acyl-CoA dehydrogenase family protein [Deltaproteobacteria bacterium]